MPTDSVAELISLVRWISDDREGNWADDGEFTPPINAGWREFQRRAMLRGNTAFRKTVTLTVPAGTTAINTTLFTALANFYLPLYIEERVAGTNDEWIEVKERETVQGVQQSQYLHTWAWENGAITFLGATQDIEIRLKFLQFLDPLDTDSTIPIPLAQDAIAWCILYTIALAKGSTDSYRDRCSQMADKEIDSLNAIDVARNQRLQGHRRSHAMGRY